MPIYDCLIQDTSSAVDSFLVLLQKEQRCNCFKQNSLVTESDRMKMVDWCYKIAEISQSDSENVSMAMQMVDRFLSKSSGSTQVYLNDRSRFQLLVITALYIAIKVNDSMALGSDVVSEMSGMYSVQEIEAMELTILQVLDWRIFAPTSIQMAHNILSLLLPHVTLEESMWGLILEEVRYQTEYAVRDYYFSTQLPSTVALAAIFNALDRFDSNVSQSILLALQALLFVMDERFAPPPEVFAAKDRLKCLVEGRESTEEAPVASETPRKLEAGSTSRRLGDSFDEQMKSKNSPKNKKYGESSPRTVTTTC
ncbi:hypothetical protein ACHAXR_004348 [Thalassiosira sp. AJA248-18]